MDIQADQCELHVAVVHSDAHAVTFEYSFHNKGSQNVYLFNKLYSHLDEGGVYHTNVSLVNVEMEGSHLLFSKKIVPVPDHIDVEQPTLPCVSLVRPGEHFDEKVVLTLPLKPWTPYLQLLDTELTAQSTPVQAWYEIGYFKTTPQGDALAEHVSTTHGPALYFYPFTLAHQKTLRVGPFPIQLPARLPLKKN